MLPTSLQAELSFSFLMLIAETGGILAMRQCTNSNAVAYAGVIPAIGPTLRGMEWNKDAAKS